jgi:transcription elongation factor GreA
METQQAFLTQDGYQRLREELEYLSTVRRREVARYLHEVPPTLELVEDGDREDAERELAFLEWRICALREILGDAVIIDEAALSDTVGLGNYVTILDLGEEGSLETYRVLDPAEADPDRGSVSYASPLGRQLLGRRIGEDITVDAPGGRLGFRIAGIR